MLGTTTILKNLSQEEKAKRLSLILQRSRQNDCVSSG